MSRKLLAVFILCLFIQVAPVAAQVDVFWASPAVVTIDESGGTVTLELAVGGATDGPISAQIRVASGSTATSGVDFTGGEFGINWSPGTSNAVFLDIDIIDDALEENQEVILIEIYDSFGAQISATNHTVRIEINDNDGEVTLPRVSLYGGSTAATEVRDLFCYDAQGAVYSCGSGVTATYEASTTKVFRLAISTPPPFGEIVPVLLETWGGITLDSLVINLDHTGTVYLPFTVPGDGPTPFGGVRILPSSNYSAPINNDFHELKISVDALDSWSPFNCSGCLFMAHIGDDTSDCGGGSCAATTGCDDGGGVVAKSASSDLDQLRRYRDEVLATTGDGQTVTALYGEMGGGVAAALFADPSMVGDFVAARNSWFPALADLLDGAGTMTVTAGMQTDLTGFLDKIAAVATGDLVTQLADLRSAGNLDNLVGMSIGAVNTGFVSGSATPVEATSWGHLKAQFR